MSDDKTTAAIKKLEWMAEHSRQQQTLIGNEDATVTFVLPYRGRLFGKRGPHGEVVCENAKREYVMAFNAREVIASCERLIEELKVEATP